MLRKIRPTHAIALLTLLAVFAVSLAVILVLWDLRTRELEHARIETVSLTEMLLDQTRQTFGSADLVLRGVQERLQSGYGRQFNLDSLPVHLLLGARIAGLDSVRSLFIVDTAGNLINSSREHPAPHITLTDRDYVQAFLERRHNGLFTGKPIKGRADDSWTIHLARPINDSRGNLRGIVALSLNLAYFEQAYDFAKLDFVRPVALYFEDGTLAASLPHRPEDIGRHASELHNVSLPPFEKMQLLSRQRGEGQSETYSLAQVDQFPLMVSVTNDQDEALASWRETARPIAIGAGLVGVFILIVAGLLILELKREESLNQALQAADVRYLQTVESTNRQLRELSTVLQEVREEERTHLSRELHDDLGQQLTGLKLDLTWLGSRVRDGRPTEPERIDEMRLLLDNAISSVRRISSDLRPPILDDLGFGEAVEWLKNETEKRSGLDINLDMPAAPLVTDNAQATALYRIVQEAFTNIIRHANASHVTLRLVAIDNNLILTIRDNGQRQASNIGKPGIGLISMSERVASLGGEFSIINDAGPGFAIEAVIPFRSPANGKNDT